MHKLRDLELVSLSAAAKRDDGSLLPLPKKLQLKGEAVISILKGLLKKGLVEERGATLDTAAWRSDSDGHRMMLSISNRGLRAIGVEPNNERQTQAIADEIEIRLKKEFQTYPNSVEGRRQGEWILMDYVDFVVHIFLTEKRAYYDIERLRKSAQTVDLKELKTMLVKKTAVARAKPAKKAVKKAVAKKAAKAAVARKPARPKAKT